MSSANGLEGTDMTSGSTYVAIHDNGIRGVLFGLLLELAVAGLVVVAVLTFAP